MPGRSSLISLVTLAALASALVACDGAKTADDAAAALGVIELPDAFVFEPDLVADDGSAFTSADLKGAPAILYFGFASCPDVCPTALARLSGALDELGPDTEVNAYFVTVDPERDTPEALKAYLSFDPRIRGLSGDPDKVRAAGAGLMVYAAREELPGSALGYTMDHSSLFYFVDADGRATHALRDALAPSELAASVKSLLR